MPFSIFKPKCPVGIYDQANIEYDMQWLVERIGYEKVLQAVPFSSEQMGINTNSQSRASTLAQRDTDEDLKATAKLMNVVVDGYSIKRVKTPDQHVFYEGVDSKNKIVFVNKYAFESQATYCKIMVASVAEIFLSQHVKENFEDNFFDWLVELTGVLLGGGTILANYTIHGDSNAFSGGNSYNLESRGELTSIQLGYALALFANARDESQPEWTKQLRLDARRSMQTALRYIKRSSQRYFNPRSIYEFKTESNQLGDELFASKHDADRYIAMNHHWKWNELNLQQQESLGEMILHHDQKVQCTAMEIACYYPDVIKACEEELLDLAFSDSIFVRAFALKALTSIELTHDSLKALSANLMHDNAEIVAMACSVVTNRANHATLLIPHLTESMRHWIGKCNFPLVHQISTAIVSIDDNAEAWLFERFGDGDPDFLHLALESYQNARAELMRQVEQQAAANEDSAT